MADLTVAEQTLVGRVMGGHVDDLPFATVTAALGLGKYVAVGFNDLPTWTDPAAADWADVVANDLAWVQHQFDGTTGSVIVGHGDGTARAVVASTPFGGSSIVLTDANGFVGITLSDGAGTVEVDAGPGQTAPLLDLRDNSGARVFKLQPDGSVGGVTPNDGDQLTWDAGSGTIKWKGPLV